MSQDALKRRIMALGICGLGLALGSISVLGQRGRGAVPLEVNPAAQPYLCLEHPPGRARSGNPSKPTPFSGSPGLRLLLHSGATLTSDQLLRFSNAAVGSLGLWHYACELCAPTSVGVILVNDRLFVNNDLLDALATSKFEPMPKDVPSVLVRLEYFEAREFLFSYRGARGGASTYIETPDNHPGIVRLRSADVSTAVPSIRHLHDALTYGKDIPTVEVVLVGDATSCGNDEDIVACAVTDRKIELNVASFKFVDGDQMTVIGQGQRSVSLLQVLLHESGHWLGLPHDNGSNNIMASALNHATCLTDGNMKTLEGARENDWPRRLTGAGALYCSKR